MEKVISKVADSSPLSSLSGMILTGPIIVPYQYGGKDKAGGGGGKGQFQQTEGRGGISDHGRYGQCD